MKVLVVDDDRGLRQSVSFILQDGGYLPRVAPGGEEGLEAAEAFGPTWSWWTSGCREWTGWSSFRRTGRPGARRRSSS
jgi:DNA-binding response OmpR family regulator